MNLYFFVNFLILLNFFVTIIFIILSLKFPECNIFKLLKYSFEASLVGAIADSYAVFGLFYKLGPHTEVLLRNKKKIIEKVKIFVGEFLFKKEFLDKELDQIEINVLQNIDNAFLKEKIEKIILKNVEKYKLPQKILKLIIYEISEKIIELITKNKIISKKLNDKSKYLIKKIILENHNVILDLIEKRLTAINDKEFVEIIKSSSWNELQWIRLNGTILGFIIGVLIGILNVYLNI